MQKAPAKMARGFLHGAGLLQPGQGRRFRLPCKLLCRLCRRGGGASSGSGSSSSVGSSLVGFAAGGSGAVGSIGGRLGCVGSSSIGCRCSIRHNHDCRGFHWRRNDYSGGFFLLATGSESSNSDQRSQNERFVHFRIPYRQTDKNGCQDAQLLQQGFALAKCVSAHTCTSSRLY